VHEYVTFQTTKEDLAKEQGMMSALITKVIDNLQLSLSKIHIRVENVDNDVENNQFSMGVTLQSIDLYTTDKDWNRQFVDRSKMS
jgi:vacuolar protein sorting-associated protein 13A/C